MGVSFKVSKTGKRYIPKLLPTEEDKDFDNNGDDSVSDSHQRDDEVCSTGMGAKVADPSSTVIVKSQQHSVSDELKVSFSLKLFQNGFSVGKATELLNGVPEHLHPYDRASETLFSAIECGWLPGDIFDDLPCTYVNGAILCEIQDYRNCLIHGRATNSTEKIPSVHKVLLHMRMENVVKDILSISDESWTYRDFLEVESHILKALQPDLHLNPQPLQDRYSGEPLSKKVDLGITRSWKKRKLSNASNADLNFCNSSHVTGIPVNYAATQSCSSLYGLSYQERGATFSEHNVSTSAVTPQKTNIMLENSLSNPLTSQPISKVADSCSQSALTVATTSNSVSLPKRSLNNFNNDLSKPSSLLLGKTVRCETEAVKGSLLKKPKQEPVDSSYQKLVGTQTEKSSLPYLQWRNKLVQHRKNGKVPSERSEEEVRPSLIINNGQRRSFQVISELQAGLVTSNVKLEPDKDGFPGSNFRKIKDEVSLMDRILIQSNLLQSQKQHSSPLFGNDILADTSWKHMGQHVDRNIENRSDSEMRKELERFQVMTHERRASSSSANINSLPSKVSLPAKKKTNPRPKCSTKKNVDSSASMSHVNAANANHVDSCLERFLKIQAVAERYAIHNRKCKLDSFPRRKPFSSGTQLVASQILALEDNGKWENTSSDKVYRRECSMDQGLGMCRTRTLTFLHQSHIPQENAIPIVDREAQVRLVVLEKFNEGMVKPSVLYRIKNEMSSKNHPLLPAFTSTHSANFLASEFTKLMDREGYYLSNYQAEPQPLKADGRLSSQWYSANITSATPVRTIELPSSTTLTPRLSPSSLSPISMQSLSQNVFSGGQSAPTKNIHSAVQIPSIFESKQLLDIAAQVNCINPQFQQLMNRHAYVRYQTLQRQKQQNALVQRRWEAGGLGAGAGVLGMIKQGGAVQGLGNAGLGSCGKVMGMRTSTPPMALGGGRWMPLIGHIGQSNNLGSEVSGSNDSKLLLVPVSDHPAMLLSKLRAAEGQGKALMTGGVPVQRNAGHGVPMDLSNILDIASKLNNHSQQQQLQSQMHQPEMRSQVQQPQQNMMQPKQEMMPFLQRSGAASLAQHVGSPQTQVSFRQSFDQLFQVSQQLSPESAPPQQVNGMVGYGGPEMSSQTHGSGGSSKA